MSGTISVTVKDSTDETITGTEVNTFPYRFVPKEDITAYELARIMQATLMRFSESTYETLPNTLKRHFVRRNNGQRSTK